MDVALKALYDLQSLCSRLIEKLCVCIVDEEGTACISDTDTFEKSREVKSEVEKKLKLHLFCFPTEISPLECNGKKRNGQFDAPHNGSILETFYASTTCKMLYQFKITPCLDVKPASVVRTETDYSTDVGFGLFAEKIERSILDMSGSKDSNPGTTSTNSVLDEACAMVSSSKVCVSVYPWCFKLEVEVGGRSRTLSVSCSD